MRSDNRYMIINQQICEVREFAHQMAFGGNLKGYGDELDFGNKTMARRPCDVYTDQILGKLGELAFCAHAWHTMRLRLAPDMEVYENKMVSDGGADFVIGHNEVDVKTTRGYSRWLMVERSRFKPGIVYAVVKMDLPREFEGDPAIADQLKVARGDVLGFIKGADMLRNNGLAWFDFRAGTMLPKGPQGKKHKGTARQVHYFERQAEYTKVKLKGDNIAWPISWLNNRLDQWRELARQEQV